MSAHNQKLGAWGESIAASYLTKKGYRLAERNARTPYGELDLVMERGGITVFVEVKTRTSRKFGAPEIAVTRIKEAHLRNAAQAYAEARGIDHWQIDVIAVEGRPGSKTPPEIVHFEAVLS